MPSITKKDFKNKFPRRFEQANSAKIIIAGMRHFECFFDETGEYIAGKSTLIIRKAPAINFKYLTCLLNSKIIKFFLQQNYSAQGIDGGINFNCDMVENLPYADFKGKQFDPLFDYIVKVIAIAPIYSFLICLIDAMVYELYFPKEIKTSGCEVLKHLTHLPELNATWSDEQKLAVIEKVYNALSDPKHPVSIAMGKQKNVSEVRIIEGLDKG